MTVHVLVLLPYYCKVMQQYGYVQCIHQDNYLHCHGLIFAMLLGNNFYQLIIYVKQEMNLHRVYKLVTYTDTIMLLGEY